MGFKFGWVGTQPLSLPPSVTNEIGRTGIKSQVTKMKSGGDRFSVRKKSGDRKGIKNPRSPPIQLVFYEESAA